MLAQVHFDLSSISKSKNGLLSVFVVWHPDEGLLATMHRCTYELFLM